MEISQEQYIEAFNGLPEVIRSYIVDGKIDTVVADMGKKYSLHADVTGKLLQDATYMLMGLMSPAELLGELVLAETDTGVAKSILGDLNQRIFIPLREQVREGTDSEDGAPNAAPAPSTPHESDAPYVEAMPETKPQAPALPEVPVQQPQASSAQTTEPSPVPVAPVYQQPAQLPYARTMAGDMENLSEGLHPGSATPARSFQTASVPVTRSAPAVEDALDLPERVYGPITPLPASDPLMKEYGSDPYREPLS